MRDELLLADAERRAQLLDAVALDLQAARRRRHRHELDEVAEPVDAVEMDAHVSSPQQATRLLHDDSHAQGVRQGLDQRRMVGDLDDTVKADLGPASSGDELGGLRWRLAELQPTLHGMEVGIALMEPALVLGASATAARSVAGGSTSIAFGAGPASW